MHKYNYWYMYLYWVFGTQLICRTQLLFVVCCMFYPDTWTLFCCDTSGSLDPVL